MSRLVKLRMMNYFQKVRDRYSEQGLVFTGSGIAFILLLLSGCGAAGAAEVLESLNSQVTTPQVSLHLALIRPVVVLGALR